jgi:Rad3-related DNA helicase
VLTGALPEAIRQNLALFFLTAKNTHKKIVGETIQRIAARGLHVRTLFLTARETLCLNGTENCSPEACPWAEVFADRVREHDLLERLLEIDVITPDLITALAKEAVVCPFELSLALSTRCDLIVSDYNYVFDPHVYLRRFFMEESSSCRCSILIDEAANLPSRAREYYSPEIRLSWLETLRPFQNAHRKPFRALLAPWRKLFLECSERLSEEDGVEIELPKDMNLPLKERRWHSVMLEQREFPRELRDLSRAIQDFARISRITDDRFHLLFREERNDSVLQWFCTDAADFLAERHGCCHSTVAFSATLSPISHFTSLLGLDRGERRAADTVLIPYPFPRENLSVMIDPALDTRYRSRKAQLPLLVGRIREIAAEAPGTWLLFFPSYDYLGMTADILQDFGAPVLRQIRGMSPSERTEFINSVESGGHLTLTVSGGIFSEGIDLRIPDLKGAMVVGPCLPGIDLRSRLLSERFQAQEKDGFLHTWVIPGMNRVIQAAGRLVRSPEDKAQLILLGRRFTRYPYVKLLPTHWFRDGKIELLSPGERF